MRNLRQFDAIRLVVQKNKINDEPNGEKSLSTQIWDVKELPVAEVEDFIKLIKSDMDRVGDVGSDLSYKFSLCSLAPIVPGVQNPIENFEIVWAIPPGCRVPRASVFELFSETTWDWKVFLRSWAGQHGIGDIFFQNEPDADTLTEREEKLVAALRIAGATCSPFGRETINNVLREFGQPILERN